MALDRVCGRLHRHGEPARAGRSGAGRCEGRQAEKRRESRASLGAASRRKMNFNEQHDLKTLPERMASHRGEDRAGCRKSWPTRCSTPATRSVSRKPPRRCGATGRTCRGGRSLARTRNAQGRARRVGRKLVGGERLCLLFVALDRLFDGAEDGMARLVLHLDADRVAEFEETAFLPRRSGSSPWSAVRRCTNSRRRPR